MSLLQAPADYHTVIYLGQIVTVKLLHYYHIIVCFLQMESSSDFY